MKQILVVDDQKAIRESLSIIIRDMGHQVFTASDGDEGLYLFVNHQVDLVMTDFDMPRMNGRRLAHIIKSRSPGTPVVLVTGSHNYESRENSEENLFDVVLPKPFQLLAVTETVNQLLRA